MSENKVGRPSKLTPELLDKAKTYLSTCVDSIEHTEKGALSYVNVELPTLEGLAIYIGINKDTLQEWCKSFEVEVFLQAPPEEQAILEMRSEFSVLVKDVLLEQGKRLINKSLGGLYQPKIAGMMLSKHGYIEKNETDLTSKGDKITQPTAGEDIAEIAKRVSEELRLKKLQ